MKTVLALLVLTLSGCSTYSTHLKTGCIWSCAEWQQRLAEGQPNYSGSGVSSTSGIRAQQIFTPQGGFMVIQSGSTTSVIQTSKSR